MRRFICQGWLAEREKRSAGDSMDKGEPYMQQRRDIRDYRDELKGLAILWVAFSHARLGLGGGLGVFLSLGYAGVDIFFFLTGFGLYHSLAKSRELKGYLLRRARRILPAYLPLCALWLCVMLPKLGLSAVPAVRTALGNLLMIGLWADVPQMLSWYVSALVAAILLAPFLFACMENAKRPALAAACILGALLLAGVCFAFDERLIAVSRMPVFALGMLYAMPVRREQGAAAKAVRYLAPFAIGAGLLCFCWNRLPASLMDYGMYWYPFALMTAPICAGAALGFRKLNGLRRWFAPLRYVGRASFEIFLLNCFMELYCKKVLNLNDPAAWLWLTLSSLLAGCAYHWAVESLAKLRISRKAA